MAFRERSAWVMLALMGAAGIWYASSLVGAWREIGAPPPAWVATGLVVLLVIGSIMAQAVLGIGDPKGANAPADERERPIVDRSGHWSGLVLGVGVVSSLLTYPAHGDGNLLFHSVMGSLILSSLAEYGFLIALLRRGI